MSTTVTDTSSPIRSVSPIRRVKINISAPQIPIDSGNGEFKRRKGVGVALQPNTDPLIFPLNKSLLRNLSFEHAVDLFIDRLDGLLVTFCGRAGRNSRALRALG